MTDDHAAASAANGDDSVARATALTTSDITRADSYYGRPIVKPHVWTPLIPTYFWIGGMAGAASVHAAIARARGQERLANVESTAALVGIALAPVLLTADLGVPSRFLHMLRVFKPTSPMSLGTWTLVTFAGATMVANGARWIGFRPQARTAEVAAAALGPLLVTYTAVLIADTATPAWHAAYAKLPYLFVASGIAAAGAVGCAFAPPEEAESSRRMMVVGSVGLVVAGYVLERGMGPLLSEPYRTGLAGFLKRITGVVAIGAAILAIAGRKNRTLTRVAAAATAAAGIVERFAVFEAGKQSACDPRYVVEPQRARVERRGS